MAKTVQYNLGGTIYPDQYWRESCLVDRGYHFVKRDGNDMLWELVGVRTTYSVRVKPNGDTEEVKNET